MFMDIGTNPISKRFSSAIIYYQFRIIYRKEDIRILRKSFGYRENEAIQLNSIYYTIIVFCALLIDNNHTIKVAVFIIIASDIRPADEQGAWMIGIQ